MQQFWADSFGIHITGLRVQLTVSCLGMFPEPEKNLLRDCFLYTPPRFEVAGSFDLFSSQSLGLNKGLGMGAWKGEVLISAFASRAAKTVGSSPGYDLFP